MLRAMVGIGVLCALLIVLTFEGTKPRIENLKAEALQAAIFKVIPGISETREYIITSSNELIDSNGKTSGERIIYAGYNDAGKLIGLAIPAEGQGYADIIRILYGYDPIGQKVIGFYVLESKETPGLGDKIEKDENFLANFKGLDVSLNQGNTELKNSVIAVKSGEKNNAWEVDGITGATISSRAIADIINSSSNELGPLIQKNIEVFENSEKNK